MSALSHNEYFDGQVQSVGFERKGRRFSVGVVSAGEFHFGTHAPERMTIVSGELEVKAGHATTWVIYPSGTAFEVAGQSGFDVRAREPVAYLCEFL